MKKIFSAISFLLFLTSITFSQTVISKYAGEFLSLGVGGRYLGMGGAAVATANDVTAGYWNPSALASIDYPQFSLMHEEHFGSLVNYNYAAVAIPYQEDMSFGLSFIRLSVDGIPDTREALYDASTGKLINDINNPNAVIDKSKIKEFSDADYALFFSFAKRYNDKLYLGANVKFIRRSIAEYSATGIGFDISALYMVNDKFTLGAVLRDATTTLVAWDTGRNELISPTLKIGGVYSIEFLDGYFRPAFDTDIRFEGRDFASNLSVGGVSFDFHYGLEYTYKEIISIRGGYNDIKQFTVGAGFKLPKLNIDYSFARMSGADFERLPDTHRISIMLTLEEPNFLRKK